MDWVKAVYTTNKHAQPITIVKAEEKKVSMRFQVTFLPMKMPHLDFKRPTLKKPPQPGPGGGVRHLDQ